MKDNLTTNYCDGGVSGSALTTSSSCTDPAFSVGYLSANDISASLSSWSSLGQYGFSPTTTMTIDDEVRERIEKFFEEDGEFIPMVQNFLIKYLDEVLECPNEIIEKLIKHKDAEIISLKEKLQDSEEKYKLLENRLEYLETLLHNLAITPGLDRSYPPSTPIWVTSPYTSTSGGYSTSASTCESALNDLLSAKNSTP